MRKLSNFLRQMSVNVLQRENLSLITEGGENTTSTALLKLAADHYNLSSSAYCEQMRHERTWGGGPEIVALCNFLRRPIHVYELESKILFRKFELKLCARFGSPNFDSKAALTILCADGRLVC